uniref:Uncharacterized protein n=1 Tax=uncultured prokaryote TaxID=198431 RepID=A0A0H5Q5G0_9ZZZZ|nr:hypothetical protein [uncultured prokaryote]
MIGPTFIAWLQKKNPASTGIDRGEIHINRYVRGKQICGYGQCTATA